MNHSATPVQDHPTVDELEALKRLEIDGMSLPEAMHRHLSGRLSAYGHVVLDAQGEYVITDKGRALIRRQDS